MHGRGATWDLVPSWDDGTNLDVSVGPIRARVSEPSFVTGATSLPICPKVDAQTTLNPSTPAVDEKEDAQPEDRSAEVRKLLGGVMKRHLILERDRGNYYRAMAVTAIISCSVCVERA